MLSAKYPGQIKWVGWFVGLVLLPLRAPAQSQPRAELRGHVISRSDAPIAGAEVLILRDSLSASTDSAGRFSVRLVSPGEHLIRVRRIGFQPQYLSATFRPGERREVTIVLTPGAYQLPEVEVIEVPSKPLEYGYTTKYDEFFRRQRIGLGHYLTRKDIDRRAVGQTSELLMGLPGVQIIPGAPGIRPNSVRLRSCEKASVWVDGVELKSSYGDRHQVKPWVSMSGGPPGEPRTPGEFTGDLIDRILPLQVEMIEVYVGPAQMPAETVGNSCAAIMIWTR